MIVIIVQVVYFVLFYLTYGRWALKCYCNVAILLVVNERLLISSRFSPYEFLSRCKFSTFITRQPVWLNFT